MFYHCIVHYIYAQTTCMIYLLYSRNRVKPLNVLSVNNCNGCWKIIICTSWRNEHAYPLAVKIKVRRHARAVDWYILLFRGNAIFCSRGCQSLTGTFSIGDSICYLTFTALLIFEMLLFAIHWNNHSNQVYFEYLPIKV